LWCLAGASSLTPPAQADATVVRQPESVFVALHTSVIRGELFLFAAEATGLLYATTLSDRFFGGDVFVDLPDSALLTSRRLQAAPVAVVPSPGDSSQVLAYDAKNWVVNFDL
jgi:hypothetical protein